MPLPTRPRPERLTGLLNEALLDSRLSWNPGFGEQRSEPERLAKVFRAFMKEASLGSTPVRRTWRRPDGRTFTVNGRDLADLGAAESARGTPLMSTNETDRRGFLMLAIERGDLEAVRWAMRCGFNPCRFDPDRKATPMGMAAIEGNDALLEMMWSSGADVLLTLRAEHNPRTADALGTTLLHRVMGWKNDPDDFEGRARVAVFLASVYPDPLPLDDAGRSPLDHAHPGPVADAVALFLAQRAERRLTHTLDACPNLPPAQRLRM